MVTADDRNILLLADQPWEAEFMAKVGNRLMELDSSIRLFLIFTDYYSFLSRNDFLSGLRAGFQGEVFTQREQFEKWQVTTDNPEVNLEFLKNWESKYCVDRSLEEIAHTNQWIYGDERSQWYFSLNDTWKTKILEDTIRWCEGHVAKIKPNSIISISRSTLPINIFQSLAKIEEIPFYTNIHSRIGSRTLLREDFGYGVSDELYRTICQIESDGIRGDKALELANDVKTKGKGSYNSLENEVSSDFLARKSNILNSLVKDLRRWIGKVYARFFIQRFERTIKVRRVSENFLKMSYFDLRAIIIQYSRLIGFRNFGATILPTNNYFLWALHARPEGSVLVLGDGKDEMVELFRCADLIPEGYFLAVKENPEMFGIRERGFYKKLKSHKSIILIDPFFPTFPLIEKSVGVIGISGTVLLEAAILNKPACALGHPEFDRFLTHSGFESLNSFFADCFSKINLKPFLKVKPYLVYVLENSDESDIPAYSDLGTLSATAMIERLSAQLITRMRR